MAGVDGDRGKDLVGVVADLRGGVEGALPREVRRPGRSAVGRRGHPGLVEGADLGVVAAGLDIRLDVVAGEPERINGAGVLVDGNPTGDRVAGGRPGRAGVALDDVGRREGFPAVV